MRIHSRIKMIYLSQIKSKVMGLVVMILLSISITNHQLDQELNGNNVEDSSIYSCSNFAITRNDEIFFGNNEDGGETHPLFLHPERSIVWFYPNSIEGYGMVQLGWFWEDDHVSFQGGINEHGLSYDSTGIPEMRLTPHPEKPFNRENTYFWSGILRNCRNISEAVAFVQNYDFGDSM